MKNSRRTCFFLAAALLALSGCASEEKGRPAAESAGREAEIPGEEAKIGAAPDEAQREEIVVLYTADTHGVTDENLGFARVAALKKSLLASDGNVILADCGDHSSGSRLADLTEGTSQIGIMNETGYDIAAFGIHEFDFGTEALQTNMIEARFRYLCCNISYTGKGTDPLFGLEAYEIADFEGTRVAFIGVADSAGVLSAGARLSGEPQPFDFHMQTEEELCGCVQNAVDECRAAGCDYVVLLSHLGEAAKGTDTETLVENTAGIDVVLEGGSHKVVTRKMLKNKDGQPVVFSSPGSRLSSVGKLVFAPDGSIRTSMTACAEADPDTETKIKETKDGFEESMRQTAALSDFSLDVSDHDGVSMVRNRETNFGDLCADALRKQMDTDIAFRSAGSLPSGLDAGEISRGAVSDAQPETAANVMIRVKGQQILEALEYGARLTQKEYKDRDGKSAGGSDSFLQVSGLRYTVDTSVESAVELDGSGGFAGFGGVSRVKKVQVETEDGSFTELDPEKEYTLALSPLLAVGQGFTMFLENEILATGETDYAVLVRYLEEDLKGIVPELYQSTQGRIRIK